MSIENMADNIEQPTQRFYKSGYGFVEHYMKSEDDDYVDTLVSDSGSMQHHIHYEVEHDD